MTMVRHGDDPALPVLGNFAIAWRQRQTARGADPNRTEIVVHLNRPAQHAERAAESVNHPTLRKSNPPRARFPGNRARCRGPGPRAPRPCPCPTASIRPSCRIEGRPYSMGTLVAWANVRYSRAGSTWYVVSLSSYKRTIRPSWLNSRRSGYAAQAQPGPAQDRVPEPQPRFPAVACQQCAGGVESRNDADDW